MARLVSVAAIVVALVGAATAQAAPEVALELGGGDGLVWSKRTGWLRDDVAIVIGGSLAIGDYVAIDAALDEDLERIEPAFAIGARVRPWSGACWRAYFSPYARAQVALVGASLLGANYDLTVAVGHWGAIVERVPQLAWFVEVDLVQRVGEYDQTSVRGTLGIAVHTRAFWK